MPPLLTQQARLRKLKQREAERRLLARKREALRSLCASVGHRVVLHGTGIHERDEGAVGVLRGFTDDALRCIVEVEEEWEDEQGVEQSRARTVLARPPNVFCPNDEFMSEEAEEAARTHVERKRQRQVGQRAAKALEMTLKRLASLRPRGHRGTDATPGAAVAAPHTATPQPPCGPRHTAPPELQTPPREHGAAAVAAESPASAARPAAKTGVGAGDPPRAATADCPRAPEVQAEAEAIHNGIMQQAADARAKATAQVQGLRVALAKHGGGVPGGRVGAAPASASATPNTPEAHGAADGAAINKQDAEAHQDAVLLGQWAQHPGGHLASSLLPLAPSPPHLSLNQGAAAFCLTKLLPRPCPPPPCAQQHASSWMLRQRAIACNHAPATTPPTLPKPPSPPSPPPP